MNGDFAFVDEVVDGIRWDAKYATDDNFTGEPVDGYLVDRIVGSTALCAGLADARDRASALGFGLLLWDAYRPSRAVGCFRRWSTQPEDGKTKLRHHPKLERGEIFRQGYVAAESAHSRGSAVDLTLFHLETGELAGMGGSHDLMDPVSAHDAPGIIGVESQNRACLRSIMEESGFVAYGLEWWHYALRLEPHPDTSFDFPIEQNLSRR